MACEEKIIPVNLQFTCYTPPALRDSQELSKAPIIFIHGFFSRLTTWYKVRNRICDRMKRKGFCISMRNHGKSGWSDEWTLKHLVADLENFMASQGIPKAILIGHSGGARTSLALALKKPEVVEKLVVEDMTLTDDETANSFFQSLMSNFRTAAEVVKRLPTSLSLAEAQDEIYKQFCFPWHENESTAKDNTPMAGVLPFYKDESGKFVWDVNVDVLTDDFKSKITDFRIDLPEDAVYPGETLFISAEFSALDVYKDQQLLSKHIPNHRIILAAGIYHCCHLEKGNEFVQVVLNHIRPRN